MIDNPQAYPSTASYELDAEKFTAREQGMTLRDHFAGQFAAAMIGTIRSEHDYGRFQLIAKGQGFPGISEWIASEAGKQADAMLAERMAAARG